MNEAVFCELLREARPKIENYARKLVFNSVLRGREDSEDLVQDTLLKAWRLRRTFNPDRAKFSTWLCEIMKGKFIDLLVNLRKKKRIIWGESELSDQLIYTNRSSETDDAECICRQAETAALVKECCGRLTKKLREVFVAIEVRGMTYKKAASFLGIPLGTLESRLHRAKIKLRLEPELIARVEDSGIFARS